MKLIVGNRDITDLVSERFDDGSCILFKYGPGSGGDILLKQFLIADEEDSHSILISTHETENELKRRMEDLGRPDKIELVSLMDIRDKDLEQVMKKDRFRNEGIMVTDILEISSRTGMKNRTGSNGSKMLSVISSISQKQVLPFRMVVDSLADLVSSSYEGEVEKRIRIIRRTLKEKGGFALLAAPLDWGEFWDSETTLFDGIIEITAGDASGTWKRELLIRNVKGSADLPERWDVMAIQNIPVAKSLE